MAVAVGRNDTDVEKAAYNGAHSPAIWFLVGFAFELFLKSAIVATEDGVSEIKSLGHDLDKALEKAEERGLALNESTRTSIQIANRTHNTQGKNSLYFRYGGGDSADVETVETIVASLKDLLEQTAPLVGQSQATYEVFLVPYEKCSE